MTGMGMGNEFEEQILRGKKGSSLGVAVGYKYEIEWGAKKTGNPSDMKSEQKYNFGREMKIKKASVGVRMAEGSQITFGSQSVEIAPRGTC